MRLLVCALTVVTLALFGASADAIDLVNLTSVGGPLAGVFTILGGLTPGLKALVAFVGFLVAAIALIAARNFAPVLYYVGVIIFLAVALVVAGSILGATL
ncbi:MAG: hypothetical protein JNM52_09345 [Betaproteobacteria bacterium]|nr:hypothetical protein [Betaproteobacteria bacterium]